MQQKLNSFNTFYSIPGIVLEEEQLGINLVWCKALLIVLSCWLEHGLSKVWYETFCTINVNQKEIYNPLLTEFKVHTVSYRPRLSTWVYGPWVKRVLMSSDQLSRKPGKMLGVALWWTSLPCRETRKNICWVVNLVWIQT